MFSLLNRGLVCTNLLILCAFAAPVGAAVEKPATYGMELKTGWIAMPDGVRLSADLYQPTGGQAAERFPVLLEYLPYRKHEARSRNWPLYSYFVQRGYVVAAVDIRGTGNSEGRIVPYEYSDIEHADGDAVIDWLSKQPWSNGNVGMFGISWGGFNSIQMAARDVPALIDAQPVQRLYPPRQLDPCRVHCSLFSPDRCIAGVAGLEMPNRRMLRQADAASECTGPASRSPGVSP